MGSKVQDLEEPFTRGQAGCPVVVYIDEFEILSLELGQHIHLAAAEWALPVIEERIFLQCHVRVTFLTRTRIMLNLIQVGRHIHPRIPRGNTFPCLLRPVLKLTSPSVVPPWAPTKSWFRHRISNAEC